MAMNKMYKGFRERIKDGSPSQEKQAIETRRHLANHIIKRRSATEPNNIKGEDKDNVR